MLHFLGVRHPPDPGISQLRQTSGLHWTACRSTQNFQRAIFPQALPIREASLRRKSLLNQTGHNCRRTFSGIAGFALLVPKWGHQLFSSVHSFRLL